MASYRWVGGVRVSVQDGSRLLKTDEAAAVLGVPVSFVRELVRSGRLPVEGTYAVRPGCKGWLVSEKQVALLAEDPVVRNRRELYRAWRQARREARGETAPVKTPVKAKVRPLRKRRNIKPDGFQVKAVELACGKSDVLVVAPTGSGKTWVAEELAQRALDEGCGLVYASPLKALSNQKYAEFSSRFGSDKVGIVTGDVCLNPGAQVLVATTEIFRNKCVASPEDLAGVRWAVLDEFHLLDSDRGTAWEEAVIFAPSHVVLVCLSATVPNCAELASWMEYARGRKVAVVRWEERPVPLSWRWAVGRRIVTEAKARGAVDSLREKKEGHSYRWGFRSHSWRVDFDWDEWGGEEWDEG